MPLTDRLTASKFSLTLHPQEKSNPLFLSWWEIEFHYYQWSINKRSQAYLVISELQDDSIVLIHYREIIFLLYLLVVSRSVSQNIFRWRTLKSESKSFFNYLFIFFFLIFPRQSLSLRSYLLCPFEKRRV